MLINNDTIIKDDNPLIRQKSEPVELPLSDENKAILRDMLKYVEDSTNEELAEKENLRPAVGISAIQIGIPQRLFLPVCSRLSCAQVKDAFPLRRNMMVLSTAVPDAPLRHMTCTVRRISASGSEAILPSFSSMKLIISAVFSSMTRSTRRIRSIALKMPLRSDNSAVLSISIVL